MPNAKERSGAYPHRLPWAKLALKSFRVRAALIAGAFATYALFYLPLRAQIGIAAGLIAIVPVALTGWAFGLRGGFLAGLAITPFHTFLVNMAGYQGWDVILRETNGLGPLASIAAGVASGYWSDLVRALQHQNAERKRVEEKLRQSEERYQNFISQSSEAIYRMEFDQPIDVTLPLETQIDMIYENAYIAECNKALTDMYHFPSPETLIGTRLINVHGGKDNSVKRSVFQKLIINGYKSVNDETMEYDTNGNRIWFLSTTIGYVENGTLVRLWGASINITERKQAELTLLESEKKYRALFEQNHDAIFILDLQGHHLAANQRAANMLGYTLEELVGLSYHDISKEPTPNEQILERLLCGEQIPVYERIFRKKSGDFVPVEVNVELVCDTQGNPLHIQCVVRDITERKRAENELRKLIRAIEQSNASIVITDTTGTIEYVNPYFSDLTGYTFAEAIGKNPRILKSGFTPDSVYQDLWETISGGKEWQGEFCNKKKNGELYWESVSIAPVIDPSGSITHFVAVKSDITENKRTQDALLESERRFSILSAAAFEGIVISDKGRIIDANEQLAVKLGYERSEMIGLTAEKFVAPESLELVLHHIRSGSEEPYEHLSLRKDGSTFPVEIRAKSIPYQGRTVRVTAIRDITERKKAEAELRHRADEFAALYETASDLAAQHDLPTMLNTIVERARALLNAASGGVYLYDPVRDDLEMVLDLGTLIPTGTRLRMGEGMAGRVAQTRHPLIVSDYHLWEGRSPQYEAIPFRAVLQVPMQYSGELIGVLVVYELSESERNFTEADVHLLSLFSEYAASAVNAARLLQNTHRRAEETSALLKTSLALNSLDLETTLQTIGRHAKTLFAADGCRIFLMEPGNETLRCVLALQEQPEALFNLRIKVGEGVTGAVAASGQAEIVNDMLQDPRALQVAGTPEEQETIMFAPLKEQNHTCGVLSIRRTGIQRPFQPADLVLLEAFASMASSAVSNARLLEETQRRLQRLSTLRQIDLVITSNLDLQVTLKILLEHILLQLEVDAAAVLLYKPELQCLKFTAGQGFRTQVLQFTNLNLGEGFAGKAALEQRVVQVFDFNQLHTGFLHSIEFHEEKFMAYIGTPLMAKGNLIGVLEIYQRHPLDPDREWMEFLSTLAGQTAIAIDNIHLLNDLQSTNLQLHHAYDATIEGWARALGMRDLGTRGHSHRTVDLTLELARRMGIEESQLVHVRRGALLHDIGKMGVPDAILLKPGKLTEEEWEIMRQHPVYAYQWLDPISYLQPAMDIPYCHHEKWDGSGYPRGLKGEQIPLAARIFAVVDVWDAMRSERSYQAGWSRDETLAYIREQSGKHFDPQVVEAFLLILNE